MEQLWYTWSTEGLGGVTGYRVRAASDGLMDLNSDRFRSFRSYLNYSLPSGSDPYTATTETSPVCLAFVDPAEVTKSPDDQRNTCVVMQKVYKGKDAYGRAGAYFVHLIDLLTDPPVDFVASDAIDLWQASFWRTSDTPPPSPDNVRLKPVHRQDLEAEPDYQALFKALQEVKDELPFVIQAFLSLKAGQKLYIAGPPERVAILIWGLTHSLPRPLQRAQKLTFSTYEQDVTKAAARVVGTCQPMVTHQNASVRQQLLPSDSFSGRGSAVALDCYSNKHAPLEQGTEVAAYTQFAANCLLNGKKQRLDNLLTTANEGDVTDTEQLILVFKTYRNALQEGLSSSEMTSLLSNRKLAAGLLREESVQRSFVALCLRSSNWWSAQGEAGIKNLRTPFNNPSEARLKDSLRALANYVAGELATAILANNEAAISLLQYILLTVAPPESEPVPWVALLQSLSEQSFQVPNFHPSKIKWEVRSWLLEQWASASNSTSMDNKLIHPWIEVGWTDLYKILELQEKLPVLWREAAIAETVSRFANSKRVPAKGYPQYWMERYYAPFVKALQRLMGNPASRSAALWYFTLLKEYGYKDKDRKLLIYLLYASSQMQDQNVESFLQGAQLNPKEKVMVLSSYGQILLAHSITPAIVDIIRHYFKNLSMEKLSNIEVKQVLQLLYQYSPKYEKYEEKLALRVQDMYFISTAVPTNADEKEGQTVPQLSLKSAHLHKLEEAIRHLGFADNKKFKEGLVELLVNGIALERNLVAAEENLNNARKILAPALSSTPDRLLRELATNLGERYRPKEGVYTWLMPYIQLALKEAVKLPVSKREASLKDVLSPLLQHADAATWGQIDAEARQWNNGLWQAWSEYSQRQRNKSFVGTLGEKLSLPVRQKNAQDDVQPEYSVFLPRQNQMPVPSQGQADLPGQGTMSTGEFPWNTNQSPGYPPVPLNQQQTILPGQENNLPPDQDMDAKQITGKVQAFVGGLINKFAATDSPEQAAQPESPPAPRSQPFSSPAMEANAMGAFTLDEGQVQRVHALKFLYLNIRGPYLKKAFGELRQKGRQDQDTEGINDEYDELNTHTGNEKTTRRMLENDLIIQKAFSQYPGVQKYFDDLFPQVYTEVKTATYKKAHPNDGAVQEMLGVFVRYRALNRYFRQHGPIKSINEWLRNQRWEAGLPGDNF